MTVSGDQQDVRSTIIDESEMLDVLLNVSQSLYQHMDIDNLIVHIVGLIKRLLNAEAVSVILHDAYEDEFIFRWLEDERLGDAPNLKEFRFPTNQGIAGSVFSSGEPELILDIDKDPRHFKKIDDETECRTQSMIAVPLQKKEKTIGVLEALNKKSGTFNDKDLSLLSTIAPIMALALDNARMYGDLDEAYKDLQITDREKDSLLKQAQEENLRLRQAIEKRYRIDQIIGNSDAMLEVFKLCEKIIDSDITVLIEGETGTGKELIARSFHHNSPRKDKPFVSQNCGGIPDTLLASELFGHKRGAFTGAVSDKKGLFEVAHGGTIFLDEVAEMSPSMQTSLLRVLQEGEIKSLGSDYSKKVDVRIISATNKDLEAAVKEGDFRDDLYYRLNVFTVKLPPLRERTGDIPILVNHFIRKYNEKYKKSITGINREVLRLLEEYPFSGNVRELENEIERAIAMAENGKPIRLPHLTDKIRNHFDSDRPKPETQGTLKQMVESLEKDHLKLMLEKHQGNKSRTAKALGLSRYGLSKKLQRYGFTPSDKQ